ncbi:UDP-N-acetylglucosamine diphosphorylase/glucosamine-1-phosphate N-acetyltransferase [Spiribacter sp. C176]|uniref:Bifunctional protein GlmU n=2 Tax=Spiribacter salilacus TaxID=2664894 RepID=A0A6N7QSQ0_9GAMM|nr:UDP-N-acetylglucosamine diphosphorylase/glucosamine-1-phosphate N-acetyltransferase [Spiribacter salilacus]
MRSATPKVLHPIAGKPMLAHVLSAATALKGPNPDIHNLDIHIVYGHAGDQVRAAMGVSDAAVGVSDMVEWKNVPVNWVHQAEQLGTGHAVAQALPGIPDTHTVLVLCADVPLITPGTLTRLINAANPNGALLTVCLENPHGYGRVIRDTHSSVRGIVEEKDATEAQRQMKEINTGVMCLPASSLKTWLSQLDTDNAQGEYYLTDCVAMAHQEGKALSSVCITDPVEVQGVNDRAQLALVERAYQRRQAESLMREHGLALADPNRFDLRGHLSVGKDCFVDVDVIIEGNVTLGDGVRIGPFCRIQDTHIDSASQIHAHCDIQDTHISSNCSVGPFARLRPGTKLDQNARIGNFVETKKVTVGEGSKINHLSYIGDATLGVGVNVGAGTITCNYDGKRKYDTHIDDHAFIGSNTALVAPITIGKRATIGAGSTLRESVPPDTLAVGNKDTHLVHNWRARSKPSKSD